MINVNNTPIIKDASDLKAPYINTYNQVFVQNEKAKLVIHHEIYPVYLDETHTNIIPNEAVLYFLIDNKDNVLEICHSLYDALCKFYKIK